MSGFRLVTLGLLASLGALTWTSRAADAHGPWCLLPHHDRIPNLQQVQIRETAIPQVPPNNTPASAQVLPLGFKPGQDSDLTVSGALNSDVEVNYYRITLAKGDVIGAATQSPNFDSTIELDDPTGLQLLFNDDGSGYTQILPTISPFPIQANQTDAVMTYVAPAAGDFLIKVGAVPGSGSGKYTLPVRIRKPFLTTQTGNAHQIIFLDFSGPTINPFQLFGTGVNGNVSVSAMNTFLTAWGLTAADESPLITKVQSDMIQRFNKLRLPALNGDRPTDQIPGHFDVEFRNSRDNPGAFGLPNVSRVIIGGTINETQLQTIGIASSIDPGNFKTDDSAIVLLDLLSAAAPDPNSVNSVPLAAGYLKIDAVALTVSQVAAHECGHFLGNWHTQNFNNVASIMDQGGDLLGLIGVGADGTLGTADDINVGFAVDVFQGNEGTGLMTNFEHTDVNTAFSCSTGGIGLAGGGSLEPRPDLVVVAVAAPASPLLGGGGKGVGLTPDGVGIRAANSTTAGAIVAGQPFSVNCQVFNRGNAPAGDFFVALFSNLSVQTNSSAGAAVPPVLVKGPLAAGDTATLIFPQIVYPVAGNYTIAVLADSENNVLESNHQNNMFFVPVTVLQPGTDLLISSVQKIEVVPGTQYIFNVTVTNSGGTPAPPFNLGFYINRFSPPGVGEVPDQSITMPGFPAGFSQTISFTLPTQNVPRAGTSWFFADYTNVVPEINKTNNLSSVTWGVPNDAPLIVSPITASTTIASTDPSDPAVTFTVAASDPNGDLLNYVWNFGDGTILVAGSTVTHKFLAPGLYTITVSVSDGPFHTITSSINLEVIADRIVDLGLVSLSASSGKVKFKLALPAPFIPADHVKSKLISGNAGEKVRYSNFVLAGKTTSLGVKLFTIEYQARTRPVLKRVRYKYTVVN